LVYNRQRPGNFRGTRKHPGTICADLFMMAGKVDVPNHPKLLQSPGILITDCTFTRGMKHPAITMGIHTIPTIFWLIAGH
jgi:hypothetical protein